jgi:methionine synthase II (cobalamin-independent)
MATAIGSLPHVDEASAMDLVLRLLPDLPAAPQLPRRSTGESMLAQVAAGVAGIHVDREGRLHIDPATVDPTPALDQPAFHDDSWGGLNAFLAATEGRTTPIKVQLAGPVTLALALVDGGVSPAAALPAAGLIVEQRGAALVQKVKAHAPKAPVVAFLDEPGLTVFSRANAPFDPNDVIEVLSAALASLGSATVTGVHCCGPTDWRLLASTGPDVISAPVGIGLEEEAGVIAPFLEQGGIVAWGAVPTDRPVSDDIGLLCRQLVATWRSLRADGCDSDLLRTRALITPACGMAGHGVSQAERALRLTAAVSARINEAAA